MILSGSLSLTVLPALIIWVKPKFLQNIRPWGLEEKIESIVKKIPEKLQKMNIPGRFTGKNKQAC